MPPTPTAPGDIAKITATAAEWVTRQRGSGLSEAELDTLSRWLVADPAHRDAYARAEALWAQLGALEPLAQPRLLEARTYARARRQRAWLWRSLPGGIAASLVAIAWYVDAPSYLRDQVVRTGPGEVRQLAMPDGSQLHLDVRTSVRMHFARNARQLVLEQGQARFTVVHGDPRTFRVLAGTMEITDLGTDFNVRLRGQDADVEVLSGAVEVRTAGGSPGVRLQQSEGLHYTAGGTTERLPIDPDVVGAWRDHRLVARSLPLGEVLDTLGHYAEAQVSVDDRSLLATRISGTFPTDDLQGALETLAAALPVRATRLDAGHWRLERR